MKYPVTINLSESIRAEWMMKEEGSYQDGKCPASGHVYCVLKNNWKRGKLTIDNDEDLSLVASSAQYQTSWDSDDKDVIRLGKRCAQICKEIN